MKKLVAMLTITLALNPAFAQDDSYVNISEQRIKSLDAYTLRGTMTRKVIKLLVDSKEKFIATDTITDYQSLVGDYRYAGSYGLCPTNISNAFKKDELVDNNTLYYALNDANLDRNFSRIYLYQKLGSNTYIGDIGELFTVIAKSIPKPGTKTEAEKLKEYLALLNSKGYPTSEIDGKIYISTKYGKVLASGEMYSEVQKNNFSYIDAIANSVNQYKSLSIQAKPYITKLSNHYSAHLNKTMTKSRMITWRNDAKIAISIFNKIKNLTGIEDYNFLHNIDTDIVNATTEFIQAVNGTRTVLGM